jgi:hypothetical protein
MFATNQNPALEQPAIRKPLRFSVVSLLMLTVIIAVALTIARLSHGSAVFGSLASPWTWTTIALIAVGWFYVQQIASRGRLVVASIAAYAISMALPALQFGDDPIMFGWLAWLYSYVYGYGYVAEFFVPPDPNPNPFGFTIDWQLPFACFVGLLANSLLILGWISFFVSRYRRRPPKLARGLAWSSLVLMFVCVVPIAAVGGLLDLYPGYAVWVLSAVLMAIGVNNAGIHHREHGANS